MSLSISRRTKVAAVMVSIGLASSAVFAQGAYAATATGQPKAAPTLQSVQKKAQTDISVRLATIGKLQALIGKSKDMTPDHKATLDNLLSADQNGLTQLGKTIASDTTESAAAADANKIFTDYRIYYLVVPKVDLTNRADASGVASARELTEIGTLNARLTKLGANPANASAVASAQQLLNQAKTNAQDSQTVGTTSLQDEVGQLLGLQATAWPSNQSARDSVRTAVDNASSVVKNARSEISGVRSAIKGLKVARASQTNTKTAS